MPRVLFVFIGSLLVVTACSNDAVSSTAAERVEAATTSIAPDDGVDLEGATANPADEFVPDYSVLIATIESAMEGTSYEGAALEDPEVFIATAELFCDLLEEGMTQDELLAEYLDRLSDGGDTDVDEDDGLMAGVLLGASVEIVCPVDP